jgi:predicted permease
MSPLLQDLRYALRTLRRSPAFAAAAIATLALGIGANAAIFALVDRVLIRQLPVRNPGELVLLRSPGPRQGSTQSDGDDTACFSYPMYRDLRDRATVFAGLVGEQPFDATVAARGSTEFARGELVTGNYFGVLGVPPSLGRVLGAADDRTPGGHPVAVLSYGYWARRFGSDRSILDQTIVLNGHPFTIVGVTPASFEGIQAGRPADLFVPMMMKPQMTPFWNVLEDPKNYWLQIVGRLKPGFSRAEAERALVPTYRPLLQELLPKIEGWNDNTKKEFLARRLLLQPGSHGRRVLQDDIGKPLVSLMGMVGLVLLIACSNLAGLLAARGAARQREYGIRLAIGATRRHLLRQSVVECLLFTAAGGILGVVVAAWILHALLSAFPADADMRLIAAQIDPRVFLFAGLLSLLAGILFGVGPAYRAARLDPARTLAGQGRGTVSAGREALRFRAWLVTAQVALTLVLLVAAGLFARSLSNLARVDLGVRPENVIGFTIAPKLNGYTAERTASLARRLTENLKALPGVRSVSAAQLSSFTNSDSGGNVTIEGAPPDFESPRVRRNRVGPDYFATLGVPILAGRDIAWTDDASAPKVAVINETMARKLFPGRNALGARFASGGGPNVHPDIEIIGIVRSMKNGQVSEPDLPFVYLPYLQYEKLGELTFYLRTDRDPGSLASALRAEVKRLDPELPIDNMKTMTAQLDESLLTDRLMLFLSAAFGVLAALLAAVGIYGVLSFAVEQRRREIGVRIALGADPQTVRRLVLGEVVRFLAVGGLIGLPVAYVLARVVESILFGVKAADAAVFAAGVLLMVAVALLAAYPPARRAARLDPLEALRSE